MSMVITRDDCSCRRWQSTDRPLALLLALSAILSRCIYLSMYVCLQDLLMRLSCRPQQTKNSVHYRLPVTPFPTSTAWRQHYVRVSRNVSPTVIVQVSHAIYLTIIIYPPLWRCDIVTTIAAPGKKDYRVDGVGIGLQSAQWIDPAGRRADDNKLLAWEWQTDRRTDGHKLVC